MKEPSLSRLIKQLRKRHGWTQGGLAAKAGLKRSHIQRLEAGHFTNCRLSTFIGLSQAFNINPYILFLASGLTTKEFKTLAIEVTDPDIYSFFVDEWAHLDEDERRMVRQVIKMVRASKEKRKAH